MRVLSKISKILAVTGLCTAIAGCAIRPAPGDYTKFYNFDIVHNIRCEARRVVEDELRNELNRTGDPRLIAIEPDDVPDKLQDIFQINQGLALTFARFVTASINYSFNFDITESNGQSGELNFSLPRLSGTNFSLGLTGQNNLTRAAKRTFTIIDTFPDLAELECRENFEAPKKNYQFPIVGDIRIAEIMKTYLGLASNGGTNTNFKESITFTSEISGSVKPTIKIEPVTNSFRLINASGAFSGSRKDIHKLDITINFPSFDARGIAALTNAEQAKVIQDTLENAVFNACVARLEAREDMFQQLRQIPPEIICERQQRRNIQETGRNIAPLNEGRDEEVINFSIIQN